MVAPKVLAEANEEGAAAPNGSFGCDAERITGADWSPGGDRTLGTTLGHSIGTMGARLRRRGERRSERRERIGRTARRLGAACRRSADKHAKRRRRCSTKQASNAAVGYIFTAHGILITRSELQKAPVLAGASKPSDSIRITGTPADWFGCPGGGGGAAPKPCET